MRRRTSAPILLAALALALGACAAGPGGASPTADDAQPTRSAPSLPTLPPSGDAVTGEVPAEILAPVLADAAERTGLEPDLIDVTLAQAVTWNDGSLGCPEPGMTYTMALVDGYHVILAAGDEELDYRLSANGGFRLCEGGGRPGG